MGAAGLRLAEIGVRAGTSTSRKNETLESLGSMLGLGDYLALARKE